ncbi:MAG TPA: Holliday junction branch migration protein RuvA [Candidatus Caccovivens faecavium]|nr:Holliday junction branch migration protein RuvA [Candidatus Caccovivens faecavium]
MISFLVGTIEEKYENTLVLDVNGVGYELQISNNSLVALPNANETTKVYTYLHVKEDGIALFGFATQEEKGIFMKLITVSGVGPKMAISILSGMKISDLIVAISREDVSLLSKIKGLGKKTAERICLELKDKISVVGYGTDLFNYKENLDNFYDENALNDAVETLINLGVNKNEAYRLARANAGDGATAEEIILKVLRFLGR